MMIKVKDGSHLVASAILFTKQSHRRLNRSALNNVMYSTTEDKVSWKRKSYIVSEIIQLQVQEKF